MSYCPVCNDDMERCHRNICPFRAEQTALHGIIAKLRRNESFEQITTTLWLLSLVGISFWVMWLALNAFVNIASAFGELLARSVG